jgi:aspartate/methionine/tyrosine aminotransferase
MRDVADLPPNLPELAARAQRVQPFIVMDVMSAAARLEREGRSIMHMEVGQPSAPTPASIRAAAARALDHGRIGYTEALGIRSLRERIARHYHENEGVSVSPERIVVTTGSSAGFLLTFLACFQPGARVAITAPGYPAYRNILLALGLQPVAIEIGADTGHVLTPAQIEAEHARRPLAGVLVMSPSNPTGVVMDEAALGAVSGVCKRLGLWFISDEIYHGLTYDTPAITALRCDDDAIIVNSLSKYYCMTGWRVGWLVVPERMVRTIERLQQNLSISVPYLSQVAAEAAFDATAECEAIKAGYAANRAYLIDALPGIGLGRFSPVNGAFYIYLDVSQHTNDSMEFCRQALEQAGVAITPGLDFDEGRGHATARLSFACSLAECEEAVTRLRRWLNKS